MTRQFLCHFPPENYSYTAQLQVLFHMCISFRRSTIICFGSLTFKPLNNLIQRRIPRPSKNLIPNLHLICFWFVQDKFLQLITWYTNEITWTQRCRKFVYQPFPLNVNFRAYLIEREKPNPSLWYTKNRTYNIYSIYDIISYFTLLLFLSEAIYFVPYPHCPTLSSV